MNDIISASLKIYAVGSNEVLTREISDALHHILENRVPILPCQVQEITEHPDGTFYVCNKSLEEKVRGHVPADRILVMNLTPSPQFYVKLAAVPQDSDVYVFNNKRDYIQTFIQSCMEVGLNKFHYIPLPYSELDPETVHSTLRRVHYIVGVDRLLKEMLSSGSFRDALPPDAVLIGASRVSPVEFAVRLLTCINRAIHESVEKQAEIFLSFIRQTEDNGILYEFYPDLLALGQKANDCLKKASSTDERIANTIVRSAFSQI